MSPPRLAVALGAWMQRRRLDLLGCGAALLYALPSLGYPFGLDQPIHYYLGRALLDGEAPYASGISTRGPATFVVHALAITVFGDHQRSIRVVELLLVLLAGLLVATTRNRRLAGSSHVYETRPRVDGELGAATLLVSALLFTYFDFADVGQPDFWEGVALLASFALLLRAPDGDVHPWRAAASGALAALAVLFKLTAAVSGVVAGLLVVFFALRRGRHLQAVQNALQFALGVSVILGAAVLAFAVTGNLDALLEVHFDFLWQYASRTSARPAHWPDFFRWDNGLSALAFVAVALSLGLWRSRPSRPERALGWVIAVALASTFGTVGVQRRVFYGGSTYHFLTVLPMAALAAMWGLRQFFANRGLAQLAIVALFTVSALAVGPRWLNVAESGYADEWSRFAHYVAGRRSWSDYHAGHRRSRLEDYVRLHGIAERINQRARPGDTLCIDGFIGVLYALTHMRCTSRFEIGGELLFGRPQWEREHHNALAHSPPSFFVSFGTRPIVPQLVERGYRREDIRYPDGAWFVLLERPRH